MRQLIIILFLLIMCVNPAKNQKIDCQSIMLDRRNIAFADIIDIIPAKGNVVFLKSIIPSPEDREYYLLFQTDTLFESISIPAGFEPDITHERLFKAVVREGSSIYNALLRKLPAVKGFHYDSIGNIYFDAPNKAFYAFRGGSLEYIPYSKPKTDIYPITTYTKKGLQNFHFSRDSNFVVSADRKIYFSYSGKIRPDKITYDELVREFERRKALKEKKLKENEWYKITYDIEQLNIYSYEKYDSKVPKRYKFVCNKYDCIKGYKHIFKNKINNKGYFVNRFNIITFDLDNNSESSLLNKDFHQVGDIDSYLFDKSNNLWLTYSWNFNNYWIKIEEDSVLFGELDKCQTKFDFEDSDNNIWARNCIGNIRGFKRNPVQYAYKKFNCELLYQDKHDRVWAFFHNRYSKDEINYAIMCYLDDKWISSSEFHYFDPLKHKVIFREDIQGNVYLLLGYNIIVKCQVK